ncbi:MAG: hypothetical protein Q9168_001446 [Polycauliona sp. 1 TL-2023]
MDRVLNIAATEPGTLFASQVVSEGGSTGIFDPGCKERHTIFGSNGDLSWHRIGDSKARLGGEPTGMFAIFFERGIVAELDASMPYRTLGSLVHLTWANIENEQEKIRGYEL